MSLRLYLDDCADSDRLLSILRGAPFNHIVVTPRDVGMVGGDDPDHFAFAQQNALILVTKNPKDFEILHHAQPDHHGVFAIYQDNDARDMSYLEIAQAIENVINANLDIAGALIVLNQWRY